jgi:hypothetical protein
LKIGQQEFVEILIKHDISDLFSSFVNLGQMDESGGGGQKNNDTKGQYID